MQTHGSIKKNHYYLSLYKPLTCSLCSATQLKIIAPSVITVFQNLTLNKHIYIYKVTYMYVIRDTCSGILLTPVEFNHTTNSVS